MLYKPGLPWMQLQDEISRLWGRRKEHVDKHDVLRGLFLPSSQPKIETHRSDLLHSCKFLVAKLATVGLFKGV